MDRRSGVILGEVGQRVAFLFGLVPTGGAKARIEEVRATLGWKFSLRAEDLHDDQMPDAAMRTEWQRGGGFGGGRPDAGFGVLGVGRNSRFDQGSRLLPSGVLAGAGQSVVAHFGKNRAGGCVA